MKRSTRFDAVNLDQTRRRAARGRNFASLVAAGSWTIDGFHRRSARCACCGRPIVYNLRLKNQSHDVTSGMPAEVDVGLTCGPLVFMESCIGFYEDPAREWERQHQAWRDYINYIMLCSKHEKFWTTVPVSLRERIDAFLQEGYRTQAHTGGWWMVKDAKKRFLRAQKHVGITPVGNDLVAACRILLRAAKAQGVVSAQSELRCDDRTGEMSWFEASP